MNILFMGTPEFAASALQAVAATAHHVVGVVTQPDKPVGRKQILTPPQVKVLATELGIPVYQPKRLKNGAILPLLTELNPDLILVVAYGRILPQYILDFPKYGCINSHGSLLPKYRGAAPIQWAIINGETTTGITTMYMNAGLDTGDIILQSETNILENETYGELYERLQGMSAALILQTIEMLSLENAPKMVQNDALASFAPPLEKEHSKLCFAEPAEKLLHLIHGTNPKPVAHTTLDGKLLKVYRAILGGTSSQLPGTAEKCKEGIAVTCGDGKQLIFTEIQLEGSKKMSAAVFLNGRTISKSRLGTEQKQCENI